jgi:N,N'-diacetylbacillosaminyl-diphospho-undecaprenol alpha-1,3-N-acetylgalactosaminyltransferase
MYKIGFLSHLDLNLYLFRTPIMQALIEKGVTVYAICPQGHYNDALKALGCVVVNYKIERQGLNPIKEWRSVYNIYNAIKDLHLNLIHTFTAKPNIYGTFAAKKARIPTILNLVEGLGSFYIENNLKSRIVKTIMEFLYTQAFAISDKTVFVNSDDPQYMTSQHIIAPEKVLIIKSVGVDTNYFNPDAIPLKTITLLRDALHLKDQKVVLMVARAIWHKGIKEYYEAASILQNENTVFLLAGDIDEGNPSSADSNFLRQGNVVWLGHRDDILELTALCDIYVLPSYREGVPRTLLEAASMGKPIVATDVVGCREVVEHNYNGLLVPPKDATSLAMAIKSLLDNPQSARQMGEHGRIKAIKEFDTQHVVDQYLSLYQNYLSLGS